MSIFGSVTEAGSNPVETSTLDLLAEGSPFFEEEEEEEAAETESGGPEASRAGVDVRDDVATEQQSPEEKDPAPPNPGARSRSPVRGKGEGGRSRSPVRGKGDWGRSRSPARAESEGGRRRIPASGKGGKGEGGRSPVRGKGDWGRRSPGGRGRSRSPGGRGRSRSPCGQCGTGDQARSPEGAKDKDCHAPEEEQDVGGSPAGPGEGWRAVVSSWGATEQVLQESVQELVPPELPSLERSEQELKLLAFFKQKGKDLDNLSASEQTALMSARERAHKQALLAKQALAKESAPQSPPAAAPPVVSDSETRLLALFKRKGKLLSSLSTAERAALAAARQETAKLQSSVDPVAEPSKPVELDQEALRLVHELDICQAFCQGVCKLESDQCPHRHVLPHSEAAKLLLVPPEAPVQEQPSSAPKPSGSPQVASLAQGPAKPGLRQASAAIRASPKRRSRSPRRASPRLRSRSPRSPRRASPRLRSRSPRSPKRASPKRRSRSPRRASPRLRSRSPRSPRRASPKRRSRSPRSPRRASPRLRSRSPRSPRRASPKRRSRSPRSPRRASPRLRSRSRSWASPSPGSWASPSPRRASPMGAPGARSPSWPNRGPPRASAGTQHTKRPRSPSRSHSRTKSSNINSRGKPKSSKRGPGPPGSRGPQADQAQEAHDDDAGGLGELEQQPIAPNFLDSVKTAVKAHLKRYKMQKVDHSFLYKLVVKKMLKMHKARVAPIIRMSPEHLRLREFIDEQHQLAGF